MNPEKPYEEMTNEELLVEKAVLDERYWDLMDQIHEQELARAALLNTIRGRHGG